MQTITIEVNDTIADKILWLLDNFKKDVKIVKNSTTEHYQVNSIVKSVETALHEAEQSKRNNTPRQSALDLLNEL